MVMNVCLLTENKQQWAMLVLELGKPSVHYSFSGGFVACASRPKTLFALFCLDFHEKLWCSGMTTSLTTEGKQQWVTLVLG